MNSETVTVHAGIEKTPGVCGGEARIAGTRIPVWLLVGFQQRGLSDVDLLSNYPRLSTDDLTHAWEYAAAHSDEIANAIRENEDEE
jgi:uncharacterized protein (DUF433 family)